MSLTQALESLRSKKVSGLELCISHQDGLRFLTQDLTPSTLRRVIKGWKEGLQLIGEGGRIVLFVPSRLAYGRDGAPPSIKRNETLIFIIDLLEVHG